MRRESGWEVETWEPTWFCFDGAALSCARPPAFAGADAPQVLAALGYSPGEVLGLKQSRAVVPTLWYAWSGARSSCLMEGCRTAETVVQ